MGPEGASHRLQHLFQPRSICLVGASERAGSTAEAVLRNLTDGGFAGPLTLVNPRHTQVRGLNCHRRISDLETAADLAVVSVPTPAIAGSLRELAARGFCHVVLPGSIGLDTPRRRELAQVLQHTGMRLVGPASLGIARPAARVNLTLSTSRILPGPLAIVSQSSAVCAALLDFAEGSGIGLSSVVSTGAAVDVDISDALDYLSFDSATRSIAVYIEGVRDARRLLSSLRAAARTKPIVVLKAGEHDIGERAVVTHSDALVSNQQTFQSAMRRCGVVMVDSFGELFSAVEWLANNRRVRGDRLAIVTNGGGLGTLAAGACRRYGVDLATLSDETIASLGASLPAEWSGGNPVNVMALATPQLIAASVKQVSQDPQADAVLAIFHTTQAADSASIASALLAQAPDAPTMYGFVGEADAQRGCAALNLQGHSVFKTPESAVRAFSVLVEYHRSQRNLMQAPPMRRASQRFDEARIEALIAAAVDAGHGTVDQVRSLELLACCGIPVPQTFVARTTEDAARLADQIGYPVALKIVSPDITHKSDIGGVRLDIRDRKELRAAAAGIRQRMRDEAPTARLEGLAIQPMIRRGHSFELLVGVGHDSVFGPVITFGAGGIAVEITADTAVGIPPLNGLLAHDLISRTRVSKLLAGYRHVPAARIDDIAGILEAVSALVCRFPAIRGLDINPLLASADGVLALDARIVLDPTNPQRDSRYRHLAIHPYPVEAERQITLAGFGRLLLRPIRPDDAEMEVAFFDGLSAQARQWRFLHPIKYLSREMIARFTQVDYDRDMALAAIPMAGDDGRTQDRIVGVARYVRDADARRCEFAIVVSDDWQSRGLARVLLGHLIDHARTAGLQTMVGYIHPQNLRMLRFVRQMGFTLADSREEPPLKLASLELQGARQ